MLILISHFADVIHSPVPTYFVYDDILYFPVKNCQDIDSFVNLFNHKTSCKSRLEPSQISRDWSKDKSNDRTQALHKSFTHTWLLCRNNPHSPIQTNMQRFILQTRHSLNKNHPFHTFQYKFEYQISKSEFFLIPPCPSRLPIVGNIFSWIRVFSYRFFGSGKIDH